ncbi:MAG TPA: alpha/beta fold hydrolase [Gemmatimonadaceae bacterium]|nr:alpha/beta fold hydrolase [Gemmatimonadaceae bacterium]
MRSSIPLAAALAIGALAFAPLAPHAQVPDSKPAADAQRPGAPVSEPVKLETSSGTVHGTLERPAASSPVPVVLFIAGSGPTDRNGNSPLIPGANNSLQLLADALAANGIASLRYDKRGIGESRGVTVSESDIRLETYVDDAAAWVKRLRADPRFTTVTIVGHSEGSLIGMLAAERAGADAVVSIAGVGRRADRVIHDQLAPRLPPDLMARSDSILASLVAGKTVDAVPPELAALYRPSVQPYFISWLRHDPAAVAARLAVPLLVAQGTTDIQVPVADAELLAKAQPRARLLVINGMNHVLKHVPADPAAQQKSYGDPSLPVAPELVDGIVEFVKAARKR